MQWSRSAQRNAPAYRTGRHKGHDAVFVHFVCIPWCSLCPDFGNSHLLQSLPHLSDRQLARLVVTNINRSLAFNGGLICQQRQLAFG
jgi:hypothetical protein